ncbi:hypothetical protein TNCV_4469441 [Trichonephila clavipes]|nr:hypothetical protein TNCV_4469441 [Trichonephila clavipes]
MLGGVLKHDTRRSLVVTGKWNAKRSSIPYRIVRCGLMWKGLDWCVYPDWFIGGGREAWLQERFWRLSELEEKFTEVGQVK